MRKKDGLFMFGILVGISVPVTWVFLLANGIIESPFP